MALPVTIPNTFANATASIPLSQLDTNFTTLANAVNGISSGSETLANASVTVITAGTANVTTLNTSGQVVFNDAGADVDFRVEGDTEANLLFVDASTDRVGIYTNSPQTSLDISSGNIALLVGADNNSNARTDSTTKTSRIASFHYTNAEEPMALLVADSTATDNLIYIGGSTGSLNAATNISFVTAANNTTVTGTSRMAVTSDGYLRMASGSGGIQFNGDTAAANALDDYEEGTWTPTDAGGMTGFSAINGHYTKAGRLVTVRGSYSFTAITGNVTIGGLPFTSINFRFDSVVFNDFPVSTAFRAVLNASATIQWNVNATGAFTKTVEFTAWYFAA